MTTPDSDMQTTDTINGGWGAVLAGTATWAGPLWSWVINAAVWAFGGMSPLAAAGAVAALWWTIERIKTERAKRRIIEGVEEEVSRGGLSSRLRKALKTEPGELK